MPSETAPGPREQDVPRLVEPSGRQAQPAQGDERVAAPVGEPRDSRRRSSARRRAARGRRRRRGRARSPSDARAPALGRRAGPRAPPPRRPRRGRASCPAAAASQTASPADEIEAERPGRREVLRAVEPARLLLGVEEVAVPLGPGVVGAVRAHDDRGHVGVRPEGEQASPARRSASNRKRRVLVVERVVVAARQERPHVERHGARSARAAARRHATARSPSATKISCATRVPSGSAKVQRGQGSRSKRGDARRAVGMRDVGAVALRADREAPGRSLDPGVEAVDEHHAPGRRRRRGQQQRVVAPRADPGDRARGEPAEAVGLEPLPRQVAHA